MNQYIYLRACDPITFLTERRASYRGPGIFARPFFCVGLLESNQFWVKHNFRLVLCLEVTVTISSVYLLGALHKMTLPGCFGVDSTY